MWSPRASPILIRDLEAGQRATYSLTLGCRVAFDAFLSDAYIRVRDLNRCRKSEISLPIEERPTITSPAGPTIDYRFFNVGSGESRFRMSYVPTWARYTGTAGTAEPDPQRAWDELLAASREQNRGIVCDSATKENVACRLSSEAPDVADTGQQLTATAVPPETPAAPKPPPQVSLKEHVPQLIGRRLNPSLAPTVPLPTNRTQTIASTCQYGKDEICQQLATLLEQRPSADAAIMAPPSVKLGQTFRLDVILDPTRKQTKVRLQADNPGKEAQLRSVKWTYTMSAQIEPGPSFEATPQFENALQAVSPNRPTTWSWKLKAVQGGKNLDPVVVRLKAYFVVDGKQGEPVAVGVLRQPVRVVVPWWTGPLEWAQRLGPIKELGGGALLALIAGAAWRGWTKRKRRRKPKADEAPPATA